MNDEYIHYIWIEDTMGRKWLIDGKFPLYEDNEDNENKTLDIF